jgi:hypothetical protein
MPVSSRSTNERANCRRLRLMNGKMRGVAGGATDVNIALLGIRSRVQRISMSGNANKTPHLGTQLSLGCNFTSNFGAI